MTYSNEAQVQGLLARIYADGGFSSKSAPTSTQLETMRSQTSAEIDVHLASVGYTTPAATPAEFITWLSLVEAEGVAAMALKAFAPESIVSENGGPVIPAYAFWEKRYQAALKLIDDRTILSPSAAMTGGLARSYLTDYPDNDPTTDGSTDGQQPLASMSAALRDF